MGNIFGKKRKDDSSHRNSMAAQYQQKIQNLQNQMAAQEKENKSKIANQDKTISRMKVSKL